jgi:hypothetical protein
LSRGFTSFSNIVRSRERFKIRIKNTFGDTARDQLNAQRDRPRNTFGQCGAILSEQDNLELAATTSASSRAVARSS